LAAARFVRVVPWLRSLRMLTRSWCSMLAGDVQQDEDALAVQGEPGDVSAVRLPARPLTSWPRGARFEAPGFRAAWLLSSSEADVRP